MFGKYQEVSTHTFKNGCSWKFRKHTAEDYQVLAAKIPGKSLVNIARLQMAYAFAGTDIKNEHGEAFPIEGPDDALTVLNQFPDDLIIVMHEKYREVNHV